MSYEDSYWSTDDGIALIKLCKTMYDELGFNGCLEMCKDINSKDLIPIFETIHEKVNPTNSR